MKWNIGRSMVLSVTLIGLMVSVSEAGERYYPLKDGMIFKYRNVDVDRKISITVLTNLGSRELKGKKVTPQKYETYNEDNKRVFTIIFFVGEDDSGTYNCAFQPLDMLEPKVFPPKHYTYFFKYPIKIGTSWEERRPLRLKEGTAMVIFKCRIESLDDTRTVLAGTFKKCLKVKCFGSASEVEERGKSKKTDVKLELYKWFAPGVGRILEAVKDDSGNTILMRQIESFNK